MGYTFGQREVQSSRGTPRGTSVVLRTVGPWFLSSCILYLFIFPKWHNNDLLSWILSPCSSLSLSINPKKSPMFCLYSSHICCSEILFGICTLLQHRLLTVSLHRCLYLISIESFLSGYFGRLGSQKKHTHTHIHTHEGDHRLRFQNCLYLGKSKR